MRSKVSDSKPESSANPTQSSSSMTSSTIPSLPRLEIFRLDPRATLPVQAHLSDAGWDIAALLLSENGKPLTKTLHQRGCVAVPTGLAIKAPEGYYAQICSRSGWALRGVFVANAPGIIDPDYTGELKIILFNGGYETQYVQHGQRVAQLVLAPLIHSTLREVKEPFPETERGDSGFGSSDSSKDLSTGPSSNEKK